ncbi:MAG: DUF2384 domain-containing protein [Alphaproteobacteria bacterium]|nr:DUF2384 domain-containing protein [Alphaproteobacteria bacterium]
MKSAPKDRELPGNRRAAVTKATLRAAIQLAITQGQLATIIGVSPTSISRMANEGVNLKPDSKEYELAVLFIRLYRSLDSVVGGDDLVSQQWLQNFNRAFNDKPINLIRRVSGLMNVIQYLDDSRARI